MGAVTFSIDRKLIETLKNNLNLEIFVETGTFKGEAVDIAKAHFKKIYSIELSNEYYAYSTKRFENFSQIQILLGDSSQKLRELSLQLQKKPVMFWLDAHWCVASNTAGETSQCPLLNELGAIRELHSDSVIVIDDARLFLATPPAPHEITQWPTFTEILNILKSLSAKHNLMIVNDCIVYYPTKIESALMYYAHINGIDWLHALDKSKDYDKFLVELKEKEAVIQGLKKRCEAAESAKMDSLSPFELEIKEIRNNITNIYHQALLDLQNNYKNMIKEHSNLINKQQTGYLRTVARKIKNRYALFMKPKLGELNLYGPKVMRTPKWYLKNKKSHQKPRISIVTPSFNQGIYLERTILSVKSQDYLDLEYIVQDGGSQDKTLEVLKRYDTFINHWESIKDRGQSNAINLGFRHATGEIMAYLNSDDIFLPGTLNYVGNYFNKHPDVDVIYGHRVLINSEGQEIGRWVLPQHDNEVLSWADYIPQETLFWRRTLWDKVGGSIDESFRFAMDWDLILRFRDAGAKFVRVPRFLGAFRVHQQQKTSSEISYAGYEEMSRLRERCHNRFVNSIEINQAIKKYLNRHLLYHKLYQAKLLRY